MFFFFPDLLFTSRRAVEKRFEQRIGLAEALAGLHMRIFRIDVQDEVYKTLQVPTFKNCWEASVFFFFPDLLFTSRRAVEKRFEQRIGLAEALAGLHMRIFRIDVQDEVYKTLQVPTFKNCWEASVFFFFPDLLFTSRRAVEKRFEQHIGLAEALAGLHMRIFRIDVQDEVYKTLQVPTFKNCWEASVFFSPPICCSLLVER